MIKDLLGLLQYVEASTEALAIAKGYYHLPDTFRGVMNRNRRTADWQSKKIVKDASSR